MGISSSKTGMLEAVCGSPPHRCSLAREAKPQRLPATAWKCAECSGGPRPERKSAGPPWPLIGAGAGGVAALALLGWLIFGWPAKLGALACEDRGTARATTAAARLDVARACLVGGKKDDAVTLLADLRRDGSAEAVFMLGQLHDPNDLAPGRPRQLNPGLANAVEFYRQACALRHEGARTALAALRPHAEAAAQRGDRVALDLTLSWPPCS
jgi:hypothetical protein